MDAQFRLFYLAYGTFRFDTDTSHSCVIPLVKLQIYKLYNFQYESQPRTWTENGIGPIRSRSPNFLHGNFSLRNLFKAFSFYSLIVQLPLELKISTKPIRGRSLITFAF